MATVSDQFDTTHSFKICLWYINKRLLFFFQCQIEGTPRYIVLMLYIFIHFISSISKSLSKRNKVHLIDKKT